MPFLRGSTATSIICGPFYMSDGLSIATAGLLNITSATAVDMWLPPSATRQDITITAGGGNAWSAMVSTGMCLFRIQQSQTSSIGLMSMSFALPSTRPFMQSWDIIQAEEYDRMFGSGLGISEVLADTLSIMRDVTSVLAQVAIVNAQNVSILVSTASLLVNVNKVIADDVSLLISTASILSNIAGVKSDTGYISGATGGLVINVASLLVNVATGTASTMIGIASLLANVAVVNAQDVSLLVATASILANVAIVNAQDVSILVSTASLLANVAGLKADNVSMMIDVDSIIAAVGVVNAQNVSTLIATASILANVVTGTASTMIGIASLLVNVAALSTQVAILKADDVSMLSAIAAIKVDTASLIANVAQASLLATVDGIVDTLLLDANSLLVATASIASNLLTAAAVNAEVVDALAVDTYGEIGQTVISSVATLAEKIGYLYKDKRNKKTATSTAISLYADDGVTVDQKITQQDDSVTYTRGEVEKGP